MVQRFIVYLVSTRVACLHDLWAGEGRLWIFSGWKLVSWHRHDDYFISFRFHSKLCIKASGLVFTTNFYVVSCNQFQLLSYISSVPWTGTGMSPVLVQGVQGYCLA